MMPLGYSQFSEEGDGAVWERKSWIRVTSRDSLSREAATSQSLWLPRLSQAVLMWWESAREAPWVCIAEPSLRVELDFPLIYSLPALCCLKWPLPGKGPSPSTALGCGQLTLPSRPYFSSACGLRVYACVYDLNDGLIFTWHDFLLCVCYLGLSFPLNFRYISANHGFVII